MSERLIKVAGLLVGDIVREPFARVKYAPFFGALGRRVDLVEVCDVTLRGSSRFLHAALAFHPQPAVWRERFYQNAHAFEARSRLAARRVGALSNRPDVLVQMGCTFNVRSHCDAPPNVIYTDYTAVLAARHPEAGRMPLRDGQIRRLIECERQAFASASHICTRSRRARASICEDYGIEPSRVTAIGGGLNLPSLPPAVSRGESQAPTALFIGKDFLRKGGDLVLRAFAQARATVPGARLICLTAVSPLPSLPLEGVELVAPTWDRCAIDALYRRADLFILPSRLETWGDVLLEAGAYGLPSIGVTGQPMEEIIEDGLTGCLVPPENADELARALHSMLSDRQLRERMGHAARQRVEAMYTWNAVVDRLLPKIAASSRKPT